MLPITPTTAEKSSGKQWAVLEQTKTFPFTAKQLSLIQTLSIQPNSPFSCHFNTKTPFQLVSLFLYSFCTFHLLTPNTINNTTLTLMKYCSTVHSAFKKFSNSNDGIFWCAFLIMSAGGVAHANHFSHVNDTGDGLHLQLVELKWTCFFVGCRSFV